MSDSCPPAKSDRDYTPEEYNRVTANARLIVITLMESQITIRPEFLDPDAKKKLSYNTEVGNLLYDDEAGSVTATCRFLVEGKIGRKTPLKIFAQYLVLYGCEKDLNPSAAEAFCSHVGLYAAYPYFRAWVSNAAAAGNVRLPPMPTLSSVGKAPPRRSPTAPVAEA